MVVQRAVLIRVAVVLVVLAAVLFVPRLFKGPAEPGQVVSTYIPGEVPMDPYSPYWESTFLTRIEPSTFNMSPQLITYPKLLQPSVPAVTVRSVNNGKEIAFLLEWEDRTRDVLLRPDDFRDGVALMFPAKEGAAAPIVFMGGPGGRVYILHWKADWQEDIDAGYTEMKKLYPNINVDFYLNYSASRDAGNPLSQMDRKSPVEELMAEGFGTLTSQQEQNAAGRGVWKDGGWGVVIVRPMATGDGNDAQFKRGAEYPIAFAVWNGANKEVGGRKEWGGWFKLRIQ